MMLTKATMADYPELLTHYQQVCASMEAGGLKQWHWGQYPNDDIVR